MRIVGDSNDGKLVAQPIDVQTASGIDVLQNVVEDTSPQLGGDLDINGNKIVSTSNGNIELDPNGTGNVLIGNFTFDADATVGSSQDNFVLTYDNSTGLIGLEANPTGSLNNVVEDTTPQLGGDLDVNGQSLVTTSNGNIVLAPNGTGHTQLEFNNDAATSGPDLVFNRTSASPDTDDLLGSIKFQGKDAGGTTKTYSSITGRIGRKTVGQQRGLINFNALDNDSDQLIMSLSRKGLFMGAGHVLALGGDSANFFTSLYVVDPTADRTITFPDTTGTVLVKDGSDQVLISKSDDGATSGPDIILERISASPAVDDLLGSIQFKGKDDAGNTDLYASIQGKIERTNSGSERGRINFTVNNSGTDETVMTMNRNGLFFASGNKIGLAGDTDNDHFVTLVTATDPTGFRAIGFPDADGTVVLTDTTDTLTNKTLTNPVISQIVSVSNGDIELDPNGTGKILLDARTDIKGDRTGASLFIDTDMSSDTSDDLANAIECQLDYSGSTIGSGTRQQSIVFKFKDDAVDRQSGRFSSEFTSTDASANKMKLIAIDHATSGAENGQIDISPKRGKVNKPFELQSYTVANLPTAGIGAGAMAYVTNDAGGAQPCFYDGSAWRRVTDRAVCST